MEDNGIDGIRGRPGFGIALIDETDGTPSRKEEAEEEESSRPRLLPVVDMCGVGSVVSCSGDYSINFCSCLIHLLDS